jgi:hypothetical protein
MVGFFFGFMLAVVSFHVNHIIKRLVDIKFALNTIFDVYGDVESFTEFDKNSVLNQLMLEIIAIEKMHDANPYVKNQIKKLKALRHVYKVAQTNEEFVDMVKKIGYNKLGRSFMILAFLKLNPKLLFTEFNEIK